MTPADHYRAAERLLDGDEQDQRAAQIHATLAQVGAALIVTRNLDWNESAVCDLYAAAVEGQAAS